MPSALLEEDSTDDLLSSGSPRAAGRSLRRHVALMLLTLAVVIVPNVIAYAASVLD